MVAAGAGIIQPWSSSVEGPFYELYAAGAAYYPAFVAQLADAGLTDVGYAVPGSIVVDEDPARLDEVAALFPPLAPGLAALLVSGGARVDGRRLRAGLLTAAARQGATVLEGTARIPGDGAAALLVDDDRIDADAVIVAAGAWTDEVLAPLGLSIGVEPQRGQIVHLSMTGADTGRWPSVLPPGPSYLVAFEDGRVVVGATRETGSGFDPRVTAAGLHQVLTDALAVAPGLAAGTVLETRVGLRPLPRRGLPVIGAVPGRPGWFVTAGFGAAGLTMAPVAGHALAQLVLTGTSDLDLTPFAPAA